jgi:hypothetical protein
MRIDSRKLDLALAAAQLTNRELCMKANICSSTLSLSRKEGRDLMPNNAGRIAAALGVPVEQIIKNKEEK